MNIGEQILIWLLVLPFGALFLVIVETVGERIKRKRSARDGGEIERVLNEKRRALYARMAEPPSRAVMRGFDSSELFREDTLLRIRKLEVAIASDYGQVVPDRAKRENKKNQQ